MATVLGVFKVAQSLFLQKLLTKDTEQMALFLVFNESATAKIALCTYLVCQVQIRAGGFQMVCDGRV